MSQDCETLLSHRRPNSPQAFKMPRSGRLHQEDFKSTFTTSSPLRKKKGGGEIRKETTRKSGEITLPELGRKVNKRFEPSEPQAQEPRSLPSRPIIKQCQGERERCMRSWKEHIHHEPSREAAGRAMRAAKQPDCGKANAFA